MIHIAVCYEVPEESEKVKSILLEHTFLDDLEIDAFESVEQLIQVPMKKHYDLIVLDTESREQEKYEKIFENEMLKNETFCFVGKPVHETKQELYKAVEAVIEKLKNKRVSYKIKIKRCLYFKINLKNVFWFSSIGPLITVNMADDTFVYRGRLNTIEREVSEVIDCFVRVNKRYLVNVKYIKTFSHKVVIMIDNEEIPLSKKYSKGFFEKIGENL